MDQKDTISDDATNEYLKARADEKVDAVQSGAGNAQANLDKAMNSDPDLGRHSGGKRWLGTIWRRVFS